MLADFLLPLCAFYYIQRTLWGGKKATFSIVLTLTGFVTRNDEKYFLHFINFLQTYFIELSEMGGLRSIHLLLVRGALHERIFAANFGTGRLEWGILRSEDSSRRITPL